MRPKILICLALYAAAMSAVSFGAHQIVGTFGAIGGLMTIGAMYGAAVYFERRA